MKPNDNHLSEFEKQGAISRAWNSIRTRYSLMTAFFIAIALLTFYIGGRIVLVHLVRDTERQMVEVGLDVRRSLETGRSPLDDRPVRDQPSFFDVAADFYSGGFWHTDKDPVVIELPVKVENGRVVETRKVSIAKLLSDVTRSAIWRLLFAVAIVGIAFVLPIFWFQSRILLNPLSKMTAAIADLGLHNADIDCPRLDWRGKDEFALLAVSVNRMLETISARAVEIANSEARQKALLGAIPDAIAVFDRQHRMVTLNKDLSGPSTLAFAVAGYELPEVVFGAAGKRRFENLLDKVFQEGGDASGAVRLSTRHAKWVPDTTPVREYEIRVAAMDSHFALALIRDVTDSVREHERLLEAEARNREAEKRESLTLLAAGIAHDMNNVLSVVLAAAEAADADPSGDSLKCLNTIRAAIGRGTSMMKELQTFAGENSFTLMRLDPAMILHDVQLLSDRLAGGNIAIDFRRGPDLPAVDVDPNQFWKVLFNIIKNAGEAIGANPGHIEISVARYELTAAEALNFTSSKPLAAGVGALFTITDNGPGIPPDILSRLFDPYVSSKAVGRGLGLATVCTIVEAHGGGIAVKSVVDQGTTFRVFLPESKLPAPAAAPAAATAAASGEAAAPAAAGGGEVLVVDDEELIRKMSSMLLKAMKFTPYTAADNTEALAVVRRRASTLRAIILDADLGGIDTVRLLGTFRRSAPNVPVIVSSGSAEDQIVKLFAAAPYDAFLAKPYTSEELRRVLTTRV